MKVKVCGITSAEQAIEISSIVDYIGFIFHPESPRSTDRSYPSMRAKKTGVFVNRTAKDVIRTAKFEKLDAIQLHGEEPPEYCAALTQLTVIKSFGVHDSFDFSKLEEFEPFVDYFLFDTKTNLRGGSGKRFDWNLLKNYTLETPFFLSGGIGPESLNEILDIQHPKLEGIDLNSRFEIAPGIKNIKQLNLFINELNANTSHT